MALKQTLEFRDEARSNPMDALKMARGPQGLQAPPFAPQGLQGVPPQGARRSIMRGMSPGAMGGQDRMPPFVPDEAPQSPKVTKIGQILNKPVIDKYGNKTDFTTEIVEGEFCTKISVPKEFSKGEGISDCIYDCISEIKFKDKQ